MIQQVTLDDGLEGGFVRGPHGLTRMSAARRNRRMITLRVPPRNSPWSGAGVATVPALPAFCITI